MWTGLQSDEYKMKLNKNKYFRKIINVLSGVWRYLCFGWNLGLGAQHKKLHLKILAAPRLSRNNLRAASPTASETHSSLTGRVLCYDGALTEEISFY